MIEYLKKIMEKNEGFQVTFCLKSGKEYGIDYTGNNEIQINENTVKIVKDELTCNIFSIEQLESIEFTKQ